MVNTVAGALSADKLGRTLMHEHLVFGYPGYQGDITLGQTREEVFAQSLKWAKAVKAQGIDTIVDATPNECGRDVEFLRQVSEEAEINIICATGYYFEELTATAYLSFRQALGCDLVQEMADMMITEIEKGVAKTGIRPGVIKLASGENEISDFEQIFFKAAAIAQKATGTPIITHTEMGTMGPDQAKLLISEGAIPSKIAIGHMCGNQDIEYHKAVLDQGVYDNFDRFDEENIFASPSDADRIRLMQQLIAEGYGEKLLMSQDTVCAFWGRPVNYPPELMPEAEIILTKMMDKVNPQMREMGMSDELIDQIQIANVARFFG